jgi:integrase
VRSYAAHLAPRTRAVYSSTCDRHIAPRLGGIPLREIDAETVEAFQGDLIASGVGPHAIRKAVTLLGALLQRAAEGRRIPYNPQRVVRKARLPLAPEVRPLAPVRVETMRAAADLRDATIVSVLAYAGLRPGELRELCWRHVRERTLLVNASKTGRRRTVRLLTRLADDLAVWRAAAGDPGDDRTLFPEEDGRVWTANGFEKWRQRRFGELLRAAGLSSGRPYDLRHSFASLLLHEGRDVIYVARHLDHGADLTLRTYGQVIEELEDSPQLPAEETIARARHPHEPTWNPRAGLAARAGARNRRCVKAPRAGFEPAAYSLGESRPIAPAYLVPPGNPCNKPVAGMTRAAMRGHARTRSVPTLFPPRADGIAPGVLRSDFSNGASGDRATTR